MRVVRLKKSGGRSVDAEWKAHLREVCGKGAGKFYRGMGREYHRWAIWDGATPKGIVLLKEAGGVLQAVIYIAKKHRGAGLGQKTLALLEKKAIALGCHRFEIKTSEKCGVKGYYAMLGYKKTIIPRYYFRKKLYLLYKEFG